MFQEFPKVARLNRPVVVTEKIDGTNSQVFIADDQTIGDTPQSKIIAMWNNEYDIRHFMLAGSRSRFITPEDDNFGFAKWVQSNLGELKRLGPGAHYGEWWGGGIQRGYGLPKDDKRFSLFNVSRWSDPAIRPACCGVVPVIAEGVGQDGFAVTYKALEELRSKGSFASPGYMNPEGVMAYHTASNKLFKVTLKKDEEPKSRSAA